MGEICCPSTTIAVSSFEFIATKPAMRILVVEDHQDTGQALTRLLTNWGFDVALAETLQSGLGQLTTEAFDVILSDIALPDGTGYALVSEARRRGIDVVAIALSAYSYPDEVQIAKLTGFDHHLTKPYNSQELRSLLEGAIDRKRSATSR